MQAESKDQRRLCQVDYQVIVQVGKTVNLRLQVKRILDIDFIKLSLDYVLSSHCSFKLELGFYLSS